MQCFYIAALASPLWLIVGYSLAFGDDVGGIVGGLEKVFFAYIGTDALHGSIPEIVFAIFQMTFAIITPALIVGAYVERTKFSSVLIVAAHGYSWCTRPSAIGYGAEVGCRNWV